MDFLNYYLKISKFVPQLGGLINHPFILTDGGETWLRIPVLPDGSLQVQVNYGDNDTPPEVERYNDGSYFLPTDPPSRLQFTFTIAGAHVELYAFMMNLLSLDNSTVDLKSPTEQIFEVFLEDFELPSIPLLREGTNTSIRYTNPYSFTLKEL